MNDRYFEVLNWYRRVVIWMCLHANEISLLP